MFYTKAGLRRAKIKRGERPLEVSLQCYVGRPLRVSCSAIMTRGETFEVLVGRNKDIGWIALWFSDFTVEKSGKRYRIKTGRGRSIMNINSHLAIKDESITLNEREWILNRDLLFIKIPSGLAREQRKWYTSVPDVSDNPWEKLDNVRELHRVWGSDREGGDVDSDERPISEPPAGDENAEL